MKPDTLDLARKALKLSRAGLKGKAIGEKLKVSTDKANTLAHIGSHLEEIENARLTPSEMLLIRSVAEAQRRNILRGDVRSPQSKEVAWIARKGRGWPASTCRKRLCGKGRDQGLVDLAGNGYITLTPLGWAFIHAIEAAAPAPAVVEAA